MKTSDHVLIRKQVFRAEEKAPFVSSGKSIQGALEYDLETDRLKCHDCGEWHAGLGIHVAYAHGKVSDYKNRHGINRRTGLCTPGISNRITGRPNVQDWRPLLEKARSHRRPGNPKHSRKELLELRNQRDACKAQLIQRIRKIAIELGKTPIARKHPTMATAAVKTFGSWNKFVEAAGLTPNPKGWTPLDKTILLELLLDFFVLNGRLPHESDFGSGSLPSRAPFRRVFGNLTTAFREAGLAKVA